jgi:hypothetical protein
MPAAFHEPAAVTYPRRAPFVFIAEARPVVVWTIVQVELLPPCEAVAAMPGNGNSFSRH